MQAGEDKQAGSGKPASQGSCHHNLQQRTCTAARSMPVSPLLPAPAPATSSAERMAILKRCEPATLPVFRLATDLRGGQGCKVGREARQGGSAVPAGQRANIGRGCASTPAAACQVAAACLLSVSVGADSSSLLKKSSSSSAKGRQRAGQAIGKQNNLSECAAQSTCGWLNLAHSTNRQCPTHLLCRGGKRRVQLPVQTSHPCPPLQSAPACCRPRCCLPVPP